MNPAEQTAAALERKIKQARAYYFHCMDCRLFDLAEKARLEISAAVAALSEITRAANSAAARFAPRAK
jgi:hypothetical protein